MLDLFDTHVHLDSKEYDSDRNEVIARAQAAGVSRFVSIGAGEGLASAARAINLAEQHSFVWASAGVHPHDAGIEFQPGKLEELASNPRVVAIGETGLDFHYNFAPAEQQERWFVAQIEIARRLKKPLIIHCRQAAAQCLDLLQRHGADEVGGVFHCYSEDAAFALKLRDIRFMISMPGLVTFKNAEAVRTAIRDIPIEQIMLETDGPFLAPIPHRGKRCESSFMVETAKTIAQVKGLPVEELARITTANACGFFKLRE